MSLIYKAVNWTQHKRMYDTAVLAVIVFSFVAFYAFSSAGFMETFIRASGVISMTLLTLVLVIGPLARIDRRFVVLLANRRHLGVATFLVALLHAVLVIFWYGAFGVDNPLLTLVAPESGELRFELFGLAGLLVLFLLAATSHDFWLANLSPRVWKALHMLVYPGYASVLLHVALGPLRDQSAIGLMLLLISGAVLVPGLHLIAGFIEAKRMPAERAEDGWLDVCAPEEIPEGRARVVCPKGAERIAVFKHEGAISAVTNVCAHQAGPLGEGKVVNGCITCPWHGYQYEVGTGRAPPPYTEKIVTYRVRINAGRVQVHPDPLEPGTPTEPARMPGAATSSREAPNARP